MLYWHNFEQCSYAKQTSPKAPISLLLISNKSGQSDFCDQKSDTHMCHPDAGAEADVSPGLHSMQLGQNPGCVRGQCCQHFTVAAERSFLLHFDILTSLYVQIHCTIFSSYFAMVIRPTLFSGLLRVLVWQTTLTASCWAWSLVGRKSPFRMYSLLSTLVKKQKNKTAVSFQLSKGMQVKAYLNKWEMCTYMEMYLEQQDKNVINEPNCTN